MITGGGAGGQGLQIRLFGCHSNAYFNKFAFILKEYLPLDFPELSTFCGQL